MGTLLIIGPRSATGGQIFIFLFLIHQFILNTFLTPKISPSGSETKVLDVLFRLDLTQNFKTVLFPTYNYQAYLASPYLFLLLFSSLFSPFLFQFPPFCFSFFFRERGVVIRGRVPTQWLNTTHEGASQLKKNEATDGNKISVEEWNGKSIIRSCGTNQLNYRKICINCIIFDDHMEPMTLTCLVILTHTGEKRRRAKKFRQSAPSARKIYTQLDLIYIFSRANISLT